MSNGDTKEDKTQPEPEKAEEGDVDEGDYEEDYDEGHEGHDTTAVDEEEYYDEYE